MKKLLLILLCLPMIGFGQNVNIPDANFKTYLLGNPLINTNKQIDKNNTLKVLKINNLSSNSIDVVLIVRS